MDHCFEFDTMTKKVVQLSAISAVHSRHVLATELYILQWKFRTVYRLRFWHANPSLLVSNSTNIMMLVNGMHIWSAPQPTGALECMFMSEASVESWSFSVAVDICICVYMSVCVCLAASIYSTNQWLIYSLLMMIFSYAAAKRVWSCIPLTCASDCRACFAYN